MGISSAVFQSSHFGTDKFKAMFGASGALSAVSDATATMALLWCFRGTVASINGTRMNIGVNTQVMLQRLFQFSITRGLLVTLVQICIVVFIFIDIEKLLW
ncbi:hypothetical protein BDZ94DRAFT_90414 [Collybia nuda]|uniref:Uncharacterized protein n=1 Tax=Collybia nuda TaxID=64659 RepID=A0A9P5YDL0_9AGAR|nr:hypothetical protein BDZ94DRAFT_90414 [Collybia nuda]